jgi:hypothetical protein
VSGEKIRIEDLWEPVLTDGQKAALAYAEANPVELTRSAVLEAAAHESGLSNFGPGDFHERLDLHLEEVRENPERTALGRMGIFGDYVRYAVARLRMHDLLEKHPEIHDVEIPRPIIVLGLPRSGTTHLVNLIAADERLRSMPLWEGQEPVPRPGFENLPKEQDPRWQRCEAAWQAFRTSSPLIAAMHPMAPDHIHEELELMAPTFTSYNQEWAVRAPKWRDYYLAHDQTEHYAYMKTGLKILQWYKPREHWVLKCPQHLEQMGPLVTSFPDATFVVTHRDPVSVIQSAATMLSYGARMTHTSPRPDWYFKYWSDRVHKLLTASVRDRHLLPSERCVDVLFHEFMADDIATVERIYEVAGLPMTQDSRAQMDAYMEAHPRGKDGQVVYDVRKDFSADPTEVRAPFDFYMNEFDVRVEVK